MVFQTRFAFWANTGRNSPMIGVQPHRTSHFKLPTLSNLRHLTRQSTLAKTNIRKFQAKPRPNLKSPSKLLTNPTSYQTKNPARLSICTSTMLSRNNSKSRARSADRRQLLHLLRLAPTPTNTSKCLSNNNNCSGSTCSSRVRFCHSCPRKRQSKVSFSTGFNPNSSLHSSLNSKPSKNITTKLSNTSKARVTPSTKKNCHSSCCSTR